MTAASMLVFRAHAADSCPRAGGLIALTTRAGAKVHVADLTYGERGESEGHWARGAGVTVEVAKTAREEEAREAAGAPGAAIKFLHYVDYPLETGAPRLDQLARILRARRPETVAAHWNAGPHNAGHEVTARAVWRAATMAAAPGFDPSPPPVRVPALFAFEPAVPRNGETGFKPTHYVVIDRVFDGKMAALARLRAQKKPARMNTQRAGRRGAQARQWCGQPVQYAEAYVRHTAEVTTGLPPKEPGGE